MVRFAPFFFWISAWIGRFGGFGRYGRFRPIHARIGPIPRESARFGAASVRVGASRLLKNESHVAWCCGTQPDARAAASLERRRVPPRRTRVRHLWCRVRASQVATLASHVMAQVKKVEQKLKKKSFWCMILLVHDSLQRCKVGP